MGVKYAVPHAAYPYFGAAVVIQNFFIFFAYARSIQYAHVLTLRSNRSMILWGCRGPSHDDW